MGRKKTKIKANKTDVPSNLEHILKDHQYYIRMNYDNQEKYGIKNEICGYLRHGFYDGTENMKGFCWNKYEAMIQKYPKGVIYGICRHKVDKYHKCPYIPKGGDE